MPFESASSGATGSDTAADFASAMSDTPVAEETTSVETPQPEQQFDAEPEQPGDNVAEATPEGVESPEDAQPQAQPAKPAKDEKIPDGVEVREGKNGKKMWFYPEDKGRKVFSGYDASRVAERVMGEPLTEQAITLRESALIGQQEMHSDFSSGVPELQDRLLAHFNDQAAIAVENGEVQTNPMVALAGRMPEFLLQNNPDAFYAVRDGVMKQIIPAVMQLAINNSDKNLFNAAQHVERALYGKFTPASAIEAQRTDPTASERAALQQERQQIEGMRTQAANEAYGRWQSQARSGNADAIQSCVDEAVKPYTEQFKDKPALLGRLKDALRSEVVKAFRADKTWMSRIATLEKTARISPVKRVEIAEQLASMHKARSERILEEVSPAIIREFGFTLKNESNARHQRLESAAQQRTPGSAGTPVKGSLVPPKPRNANASTRDAWRDVVAQSLP